VDTWRPQPVTTVDSGTFDTSQGTADYTVFETFTLVRPRTDAEHD
jgi:hypothetical protein